VGWDSPSETGVIAWSAGFTAGAMGLRGVTGFVTDGLRFGLIEEEILPESFAVRPETTGGFGVVFAVGIEPWAD